MGDGLLRILTICVLAILIGFFTGYEATCHSVKVGNEVGSLKSSLEEIDIEYLEIKQTASNDLTSFELILTYELPGKMDLKDQQKYLSFIYVFSDKTKEILGIEKSDKLVNYKITADKNNYREYTLTYTINPAKIKTEDIDYIKSNLKKETQLHIMVEGDRYKRIRF